MAVSPYRPSPVEVRRKSDLDQTRRADERAESEGGEEGGRSLRDTVRSAARFGRVTPQGMAAGIALDAAAGAADVARSAVSSGNPLAAGGAAAGAVEQGAQMASGRAITVLWIAMPKTIFHASYLIALIYAIGWMSKRIIGKSPFPPIGGGFMPGKAKAGGAAAVAGSMLRYAEGMALFVCLLLAIAIDLLVIVVVYFMLNPLEVAIQLFLS